MPKEIDRLEVQRLMGHGAQVVDVMGRGEYEASHLPGATHVPLGKIPEQAPELLDASLATITYCYDSL